MIKVLGKMLFRAIGSRGYFWPLAQLCSRQIQVLGAPAQDKIKLLALSPDRFGSGFDTLIETGSLSVYRMPYYWQAAIVNLVPRKNGLARDDLLDLLGKFLLALRHLHNFDCVVSACLWYSQDIPWGEAAERVGIPFLLFHKESLPSPAQLNSHAKVAKKYSPFKGSHIFVANEVTKKLLIDCKFVKPRNISRVGNLTMDHLATTINTRSTSLERKRAVFFSFTHCGGLDPIELVENNLGQNHHWRGSNDMGWFNLFSLSHIAFAQAAIALPNAEFVIKLKWRKLWFDKVEQALLSSGLILKNIPNLKIVTSIDAHELINDSQVVCAFNSTTLLEAAIFEKCVIVPHFAEATTQPYANGIKVRELYEHIEVAHTPKDFTDLVVNRLLEVTHISSSSLEKRRKLFEQFISPLDGKSTERHLELINHLIS